MEFHLRKGSRKDICPNCGKKTFTPYVNEQGLMLDPSVGFCDRRNKCAYHLSPCDFLNSRPDMVAKIRDRNFSPRDFKRSFGYKNSYYKKRPACPTLINPELVALSMTHYDRNSLVSFLRWLFAKYNMAQHFETVLRRYFVGTSKKFSGSPVFWLIDSEMRVRDGKIMGYSPTCGKRIKIPHPLFTNVHTELEKGTGCRGLNPNKEFQRFFTGLDNVRREFKPCFYGSHLAKQFPHLPIWLFESEKAALVVATFLEWGGTMLGIPMASGGCGALNPKPDAFADPYDRIQVLKNRVVVLFPDQGMVDEWWRKAELLAEFASKVYCSTITKNFTELQMPWLELYEGDALDDLLLRCLKNQRDPADLILKSFSASDQVLAFPSRQ